MSDQNDIMTGYQNYARAVKEANALNKAGLFDALSGAGVTRVRVEFDGEGDSGQLNNVLAYKGDSVSELPEITIEIRKADWSGKVSAAQATLHDAIEELCYGFLSQEHDGWENNDGAYGEFTLEVTLRTIELEFNGRFSDIYTTTHTF